MVRDGHMVRGSLEYLAVVDLLLLLLRTLVLVVVRLFRTLIFPELRLAHQLLLVSRQRHYVCQVAWVSSVGRHVLLYAGVELLKLPQLVRRYGVVLHPAQNAQILRVEVYGVPKLTAVSLMNSATQFYPIESDLLLS